MKKALFVIALAIFMIPAVALADCPPGPCPTPTPFPSVPTWNGPWWMGPEPADLAAARAAAAELKRRQDASAVELNQLCADLYQWQQDFNAELDRIEQEIQQ